MVSFLCFLCSPHLPILLCVYVCLCLGSFAPPSPSLLLFQRSAFNQPALLIIKSAAYNPRFFGHSLVKCCSHRSSILPGHLVLFQSKFIPHVFSLWSNEIFVVFRTMPRFLASATWWVLCSSFSASFFDSCSTTYHQPTSCYPWRLCLLPQLAPPDS